MKRYIKGLGLVALAGLVAAAFPAIKAAEAAEVVLYTASNPEIEKVMMAASKGRDEKINCAQLGLVLPVHRSFSEGGCPQAIKLR